MRQGRTFKRCTACGATVKERRCGECGGDRVTWSFMVDVAPPGAPRRQRKKGGFATKKAALAAMAELQAGLADGTHVEPSRRTVGQYLAGWLEAVKGEYRPGTLDAARLHVDTYITPRIGDVPLQALTPTRVKGLYAELAESGRVRGNRPLSRKTVHNIHRTLSRALNDAVDDRLIPRNPAAKAHKAPESPEQSVWSVDQLRAFYAHVERVEDRLFALWRLAGAGGLRRGELAGLRWPDVDLDAAVVRTRVQRAKGGGGVSAGGLKGKRGRSVDVDDVTVAALREHRRRQLAERMAWPGEWGNGDDLVFTHEDGSPLHPDSITKRCKRLVADAGLPWVKLHGLRHGHATAMLQAGVHLKVVQERLGHSSIAITGDVYSHVTPGMQADAAARVAALVDQPATEGKEGAQ